jgi:hypothetical protein
MGVKEAVWYRSLDSESDYSHVTTGGWRFASSYHGGGKFIITAWAGTPGEATTQTSMHIDREDLIALADLLAQAVGGCLYLKSEDSDSELSWDDEDSLKHAEPGQ